MSLFSLMTTGTCIAFFSANLILTCAASAIEKQGTSQVTTQIDIAHKFAKQQMQSWLTEYNLPSFSMAISVNGELVFAEAIGYLNTKANVLATANTQYSVGSIAKPMTSIALGKLLDDKKINIDADIHSYFKNRFKLANKVTVKQLASHTAGIGRPWEARAQLEFVTPQDHRSPFEVLHLVSDNVLEYVPGHDFLYTSVGYILLSALIESVSETPYVEFMSRQVFAPLAMASTELDNSTAGLANEATYYESKGAKGEFVSTTLTRDRSFLFGGGGFISTPTDLVKLGAALYDRDYLSEDSVALLTTPVPLLNGQSNPQNYALGWRVNTTADIFNPEQTMTIIHHGGLTSGASSSFLLVIPKYKISIAYATNTDPEGFGKVRDEILPVLKPFLKE